ncbi:hypothetical protein M569_14291 [Genlisea aurea]|uniref:Uncharacterized protein n=1 Tax=Genlisea aurea TaxID=192259 RepID=S8DLN9_9LAMI|nr:hypothetical protein M569_14291 [Genlisea aurea]
MAASTSHALIQRRNRSIFSALASFFALFLCVFLLRKRVLDGDLSSYSDLVSRRGSSEVSKKSDDLENPNSGSKPSDPEENADEWKGRLSSESENSAYIASELGIDPDVWKSKFIERTTQPSESTDGEKTEYSVEKAFSADTADNVAIIDKLFLQKLMNCEFYRGKWIIDDSYPLYTPGSCPYVDEAYDCQNNGRPDSGYLKWRWKPDECDLPRFDAVDFLVRLRGKRLLLVGDSMNRNQFESLLCLLREGLPDKSRMKEIHGYNITKGRGYYVFKFEDYDCTVEFIRSHFLVREGIRINAQGNSNPTLSIDRIDKTANRWLRADILVFNTGHWWTHGKTSRGKNYYKEGDYVYPHFDAVEAYRKAMTTWANWIKDNMSSDKLVFYRGYSSAHFRGGDWDSGGTCKGEEGPVSQGAMILDNYPQKMTILEEIIKKTNAPVVLLNITGLTNYRKDGHPSVYGKNVTGLKKVSARRQDCSHWCLPGVPDSWNELIYATLVIRQT